jgi:glycosyltransferase involved in cell wall biosynthesis
VFITDGFRLWENDGPRDGKTGPGKLEGTYWTGLLHVSKIPDYLWMSDCFVLPSDFEGMSNAAVEALASGLPIIGRKGVSGNVELIEPKVTGQFFETIPELAEQMRWFAAFENRQGMKEACLARSKNFSVETMCRSYLEFFKDSQRQISTSR